MTADQIVSLGTELAGFLDQFTDCFGRSEPRGKLQTYILGQLGQLPRKSIEPIALAANVKPRTLQEFLASDAWDEDRMTALVQQLVARDHADPQAIAVIDESGHPKKGCETAGVSRQYCGNTGKIDNCVMTVHLTYTSFDGKFRTMLDSSLYLPKCWDEDRERCRKAKIPDELVYRPKYNIALEQLDRSAANEVRFAWVTADEWYSQKPAFVQGLEQRGLRFVLEIPKILRCGCTIPHGPKGTPAKPVENLCRYSRAMMCQPWQRYYIKDTDKGPMVWEVKCVPCWLPRSVGPYWLVMLSATITLPLERQLEFPVENQRRAAPPFVKRSAAERNKRGGRTPPRVALANLRPRRAAWFAWPRPTGSSGCSTPRSRCDAPGGRLPPLSSSDP